MDMSPRVRRRLDLEPIAWLTTVSPDGRPVASPVWFLFDGESALVYSMDGTSRTENLAVNQRVSFHLDGNGLGGDIVILQGTARIDPDAPPSTENEAYQDKYGRFMSTNGWTPEWFASRYPIPITIDFDHIRSW
jgi:PPOX class probable F420-dependent enzyme